MAVDLIYETHSTTIDNERGIATGWLPGELSPAGREQAAELGRRYRDRFVDVIYVSDLRRAVETVEIAFAGRSSPIVQDVRLRECDYGDWNGMPRERLTPQRVKRIDRPFPNGQSYRDVVAMTASFLVDLTRNNDGQTVLVVAHSANRWASDWLLLGVSLERSVVAPFDWRPGWHYTLPATFEASDWLRGGTSGPS